MEDKARKINQWVKEHLTSNWESASYMIMDFIGKNSLDWDIKNDRSKAISYLSGFFPQEIKDPGQLNENWIKHNSGNDFNIDVEDVVLIEHSNGEQKDLDSNNSIDTLNRKLTVEMIEFLKQLDDLSYKSSILANLSEMGNIKLLRKTKIRLWLNKKGF